MKHLQLLRHGKSAWDDPGLADRDRPLAPRGRKAAPIMGRHLAEQGLVPDRVLCSTATRAHQTLALVMAEWPRPAEIVYDPRLYEADGADLIALAGEQPNSAETVMLVGHNPAMQDAAQTLAGGRGDAEALANLAQKMPTAALARLACSVADWSALTADRCRLEGFVTPKMLG